ncbi:transcription antitermination factor NusB [Patescibacteria group bacterium]|nr:transcription antitermination factor NusB [Patescibacteria group bacterium]
MKRADDPRHKRREKAVRELFAFSFREHDRLSTLAKKTVEKLPAIDGLIRKCATEWPIEKINKVDLAILRLALAELMTKSVPEKVVIDEAVELAKAYGSQSSPPFVNGVLGNAIEKIERVKTKSHDTSK